MSEAARVVIFDTTLRDGEQAPGCSMNLQEKLAVARQLERLGVDVIEAGFPISSPGDFESVKMIADTIKNSTVCGLARATKKDVEACGQALAGAAKSRIHTFIATSPIHMAHKLKMTPDQVKDRAIAAIKLAKTYTDDVEFSCEDATRSEIPFLQEIVTAAIDAGATTINLPDTVGYDMPWEYGAFIEAVIKGVPNADKAVFSVHCHNDLGMAVANSITAVTKGARQIEVSLNGIGERAGNAALEEVVMAINTRKDQIQAQTGINTKELFRSCRLVSQTTNMPIPANKAIVGKNAFLHESGIHQDGVLKDRNTYEIMNPADIGLTVDNLVLGKHSGRHAFKSHMQELGFEMDEKSLDEMFEEFKQLCDRKKEVLDEDLIALANARFATADDAYTFDHLYVFTGTDLTSTATLGVRYNDELKEIAALSEGPVDAACKAVDLILGPKYQGAFDMLSYRIEAITGGTDAQGEVNIKVSYKNKTFNGHGLSTSILEASAKSYLNAINKAIAWDQINEGLGQAEK
jgi:2-isopropylmalate synthase